MKEEIKDYAENERDKRKGGNERLRRDRKGADSAEGEN